MCRIKKRQIVETIGNLVVGHSRFSREQESLDSWILEVFLRSCLIFDSQNCAIRV